MDYTFVLRVKIAEQSADVTVQANSLGQAKQIAEAMYGQGTFMGMISEQHNRPAW